jgi:hypothetical protein
MNLRSGFSQPKISGQFPQKIYCHLPSPSSLATPPNAQRKQHNFVPTAYPLLHLSWYEQIKEAVVEEAEEAEINAPVAVEEVEAAVAVEEIVRPRNLIKDRPVDLDDVTLEEAAVVIKDVVAVEEDVEVVDAEEDEEAGVVAVEVDEERMKNRNQPPQRN